MYSCVFNNIPTCTFSFGFTDKHDHGTFRFEYKNGDIWEVQFTENEGKLNYQIRCCTTNLMNPLSVDIFDFERDMSKSLNILHKNMVCYRSHNSIIPSNEFDDFIKLQAIYTQYVRNVFQIWENECACRKTEAESDNNTPIPIDISIKTDLNAIKKLLEE